MYGVLIGDVQGAVQPAVTAVPGGPLVWAEVHATVKHKQCEAASTAPWLDILHIHALR